jgi:hypothetical protein
MGEQNASRKSRTWILIVITLVSGLLSVIFFLYGLAQQIQAEANLTMAKEQQREALAFKRQLELQYEECERRVAELIEIGERQTETALKAEEK